jgi:hypothetical protein
LLVKLDIAKAFDSVSWVYLLDMLRARGFSQRWCDWIALILSTASSRVLLNGVAGDRIRRTAPEKPWAGMPLPCSLTDRQLFAAATSVTIGDGATARFWFDSWMDGRAPLTAFADLFLVSRRKHRSVYEAVHDQRWVADLRGRVTPELLPAFVSLWTAMAALQFLPGAADSFTWRCSQSGSYSASSAYRMQFLGSTRSPLMPTIW